MKPIINFVFCCILLLSTALATILIAAKPVEAEDLGVLLVTLPTSPPPESQPATVAPPATATNASHQPDTISPQPTFPLVIQVENWQWPAHAYHLPSTLPIRGQSMYYNPGVMQEVIQYRQRWGQITPCAECIGYVALLRSGDINRRVWLQMRDGRVEGPFLVTDVAARHDIPRLLYLGWGVDVDWETAKRWGWRMPWVTVLSAPPPGWTQTIFATAGQPQAATVGEAESTN